MLPALSINFTVIQCYSCDLFCFNDLEGHFTDTSIGTLIGSSTDLFIFVIEFRMIPYDGSASDVFFSCFPVIFTNIPEKIKAFHSLIHIHCTYIVLILFIHNIVLMYMWLFCPLLCSSSFHVFTIMHIHCSNSLHS